MQLTRQLVDQDKIFAIFNQLGTAHNMATRQYLNQNQIPQVFVATGASLWGAESEKYPWTIGWQPNYQSESIVYALYLLKERQRAKIGVLYQNDDYGQDYLAGLKRAGQQGRYDRPGRVCEVTDPDVTSQIGNLRPAATRSSSSQRSSPLRADRGRAAVVAPEIFLNNVWRSSRCSTPVQSRRCAGGQHVITTQYVKDPADTSQANDPASNSTSASWPSTASRRRRQ